MSIKIRLYPELDATSSIQGKSYEYSSLTSIMESIRNNAKDYQISWAIKDSHLTLFINGNNHSDCLIPTSLSANDVAAWITNMQRQMLLLAFNVEEKTREIEAPPENAKSSGPKRATTDVQVDKIIDTKDTMKMRAALDDVRYDLSVEQKNRIIGAINELTPQRNASNRARPRAR